MVGMLQREEVDIQLGALTILAAREQVDDGLDDLDGEDSMDGDDDKGSGEDDDKGSNPLRKVQFFLTLFKRPLSPPPPLSFEHLSYFAGGAGSENLI